MNKLSRKFAPAQRAITDWKGNKRVTWCVPYAMAVITGQTYEDTYLFAKKTSGRHHLTGISHTLAFKTFDKFGVGFEGGSTGQISWSALIEAGSKTEKAIMLDYKHEDRPAVKTPLKAYEFANPKGVYFVSVRKKGNDTGGGHVLVVDLRDNSFIHNQSGAWKPITDEAGFDGYGASFVRLAVEVNPAAMDKPLLPDAYGQLTGLMRPLANLDPSQTPEKLVAVAVEVNKAAGGSVEFKDEALELKAADEVLTLAKKAKAARDKREAAKKAKAAKAAKAKAKRGGAEATPKVEAETVQVETPEVADEATPAVEAEATEDLQLAN